MSICTHINLQNIWINTHICGDTRFWTFWLNVFQNTPLKKITAYDRIVNSSNSGGGDNWLHNNLFFYAIVTDPILPNKYFLVLFPHTFNLNCISCLKCEHHACSMAHKSSVFTFNYGKNKSRGFQCNFIIAAYSHRIFISMSYKL